MKITESQLRNAIKETIKAALSEEYGYHGYTTNYTGYNNSINNANSGDRGRAAASQQNAKYESYADEYYQDCMKAIKNKDVRAAERELQEYLRCVNQYNLASHKNQGYPQYLQQQVQQLKQSMLKESKIDKIVSESIKI